MDFISSISFPNEPLISWTFLGHFCHHFWMGATEEQQQTHPKVTTKMVKKCSIDQRFIQKRNNKIHTLIDTRNLQNNWNFQYSRFTSGVEIFVTSTLLQSSIALLTKLSPLYISPKDTTQHSDLAWSQILTENP